MWEIRSVTGPGPGCQCLPSLFLETGVSSLEGLFTSTFWSLSGDVYSSGSLTGSLFVVRPPPTTGPTLPHDKGYPLPLCTRPWGVPAPPEGPRRLPWCVRLRTSTPCNLVSPCRPPVTPTFPPLLPDYFNSSKHEVVFPGPSLIFLYSNRHILYPWNPKGRLFVVPNYVKVRSPTHW